MTNRRWMKREKPSGGSRLSTGCGPTWLFGPNRQNLENPRRRPSSGRSSSTGRRTRTWPASAMRRRSGASGRRAESLPVAVGRGGRASGQGAGRSGVAPAPMTLVRLQGRRAFSLESRTSCRETVHPSGRRASCPRSRRRWAGRASCAVRLGRSGNGGIQTPTHRSDEPASARLSEPRGRSVSKPSRGTWVSESLAALATGTRLSRTRRCGSRRRARDLPNASARPGPGRGARLRDRSESYPSQYLCARCGPHPGG